MPFHDIIQTGAVKTFLYFRIGGLPTIWSTTKCPTTWDAGSSTVSIGGETYAWSTSVITEELPQVSMELDPFGGIVTYDNISLSLVVDNNLELINRYRNRGTVVRLTADYTPGDAVISVDDTTIIAGSGYVHIDQETLSYSGTTATSLTGVVGGRFGSVAQHHPGGADGRMEIGVAVEASTKPLSIGGRKVSVWLGTLDAWGYPHGAAPLSSSDKLIYSGLLSRTVLENLQAIMLDIKPITSLLDGSMGSALPKLKPYADNLILIDEWSSEAKVNLSVVDGWRLANNTPQNASEPDIQLPDGRNAPGFSNPNFASSTYSSGWRLFNDVFDEHWRLSITTNNDGEKVAEVTFSISTVDAGFKVSSFINGGYGILRATTKSIWRELGWEEDHNVEAQSITTSVGNVIKYVWLCPNPLPSLRLPVGATRSTRLRSLDGENLDYFSNIIIDSEGRKLPFHIVIGDEIMEVAPGSYIVDDVSYDSIDVVKRGCLNSIQQDHILQESGDDKDSISICWSPTVTWPLAILYALVSGSGTGSAYDMGLKGTGVGISEDYIDVSAFLELAETETMVPTLVVTEDTPVRDFIDAMLVLNQCYIDIANNGKITIAKLSPPLTTDQTSIQYEITNPESDNMSGINFEMSEASVITKLVLEDVGSSPTGEGGYNVSVINSGAKQTYGNGREISLSGQYVARADAELVAIDTAGGLFAMWSSPYAIIDIAVQGSIGWEAKSLSTVSITSAWIPNITTLGVGDTAYGTVYGFKKQYYGGQVWSILTVLVSINGDKLSLWCPTLYVTDVAADGKCTIDNDVFSDDDLSYFVAGDLVRIYQFGEAEKYVEDNIDSIDLVNGKVILDTSPFGTVVAPAIIRYADYEQRITAAQARHVFVADYQRILMNSAGLPKDCYYYL